MKSTLKLKKRKWGIFLIIKKPYLIAEIGLNYDGDLNKALMMIGEAKKSGAHAAKFQSFSVSELLNPLSFDSKNQASEFAFYKEFLKYELSEKDHQKLADYCQEVGISFMSSAFDLKALKLVGTYCDSIKIASSELNNEDLLKACGSYKKPVFLSMGMGSLKETLHAIEILKKGGVKDIFLLYCVSLYPLPYEEANLRVIQTLIKDTGLTVGFSDHSIDDTLALGSIALGGLIVEKHVTLKREERLFDHSFSMEFGDFALMKEKIENLFMALGDGKQKVGEKEKVVKQGSRRSFFAMREIKAGEVLIIGENIHAVRPSLGVALEEKKQLLNKKAKKLILAHHPIFLEDIE
jgi:N,N'-diacetyllegionaminate synthase